MSYLPPSLEGNLPTMIEHAVKALAIMDSFDNPYLSAPVIAREGDMPLHSLETILARLRKAGLLESRPGALYGGYRRIRTTTIAELYEILMPSRKAYWSRGVL